MLILFLWVKFSSLEWARAKKQKFEFIYEKKENGVSEWNEYIFITHRQCVLIIAQSLYTKTKIKTNTSTFTFYCSVSQSVSQSVSCSSIRLLARLLSRNRKTKGKHSSWTDYQNESSYFRPLSLRKYDNKCLFNCLLKFWCYFICWRERITTNAIAIKSSTLSLGRSQMYKLIIHLFTHEKRGKINKCGNVFANFLAEIHVWSEISTTHTFFSSSSMTYVLNQLMECLSCIQC